MTTPATPDRKLAKDVATELERRRRRRKIIVVAVWAALIIAAAVYLRCGRGWGIGGGGGTGTGKGSSAAVQPATGPVRCSVRVTKDGIVVNGEPKTRDEAVAICKAATDGAVVTVTGDARQGDWDELKAALEAVSVKIYMRGEQVDAK